MLRWVGIECFLSLCHVILYSAHTRTYMPPLEPWNHKFVYGMDERAVSIPQNVTGIYGRFSHAHSVSQFVLPGFKVRLGLQYIDIECTPTGIIAVLHRVLLFGRAITPWFQNRYVCQAHNE